MIVRLKKGEDFAKVAGEVAEDPSGKTNGGNIDYFTKEQMVPEFRTPPSSSIRTDSTP